MLSGANGAVIKYTLVIPSSDTLDSPFNEINGCEGVDLKFKNN